MKDAKKPQAFQYCGLCDLTFPRRKHCLYCGDETQTLTRPAWLECPECGDEALESSSGLFHEDDAVPPCACGARLCVKVDYDHAYLEVCE
jgi:hypothetical protein